MARFFFRLLGVAIFAAANIVLIGVVVFAVVYQRLPELDSIADYRPRLPMRIYSAEGILIGEFGEEKRIYTRYRDFPHALQNALLVTEDSRFFRHGGLDIVGIARAAGGYFQGRREGASTITMQVARNFYLTSERTFTRKIAEAILAIKIENQLSKEQILERYMNQIYLGQGSFGFAAAARIYYGKNLDELTLAETAVLAGLPKAPSSYNPKRHPEKAKARQKHVLARMRAAGMIDEALYLDLVSAELPPMHRSARRFAVDARYAAEEVREILFAHFGDAAYQRGLRIYTTVQADLQQAAVDALRAGLLAHEDRRPYRGPEKFIDIRGLPPRQIVQKLRREKIIGALRPAVVLSADAKSLRVLARNGEEYQIGGKFLSTAGRHLPGGGKTPTLVPGALVRLWGDGDSVRIASLPGAEAALAVLSPEDGAVLAMAGGFDFRRNQFNHAMQAKRQPGSSLKPFIYSAALEKGFTPASILPDTPIYLTADQTGSGKSWQPKNYSGGPTGAVTFRRALNKSQNLATIHLLDFIGVEYAQDYLLRFGFLKEDHPPYLTLGLGAGAATPLEMARGYAAFVNGGYLVRPYLISRVEDYDGNRIVNELDFERRRRIIDPRNAFIMTSLLQSVVREGTGAAAKSLGRSDLGGKTGTTNNTQDAWFAGFGGNLVAVSWIGYDQLKTLGNKETGSRAALPIWKNFMQAALQNVPVVEYHPPGGIIAADIDGDSGKLLATGDAADRPRQEFFYEEFLPDIAADDGDEEQLF